MSTDQKKFIRQVWLVIISAIVLQVIVGFGVLNRDHFTIKSNNEKIIEMQAEIKVKMSYEAHNLITKNLYDYTEVTRQMLEAHKQNDADQFNQLMNEMREIQRRIDRIFETYGIGINRGEDFEIDLMPEIFKTGS